MTTSAETFFHQIQHQRVAFLGLGVSHTDLIRLLIQKGIDITLCDKRHAEEIAEYKELADAGVHFQLGDSYLENLNFDILFRSPGIYYNKQEIQKARESGCVVTSEMEMFFQLCPCPIFAVTGSDGKTTTTTLISEMLKAQGKKVYLGGNIGRALLPVIEQIKEEDYAVVELSSFQLLSMRTSPDVAVVTNVSPNHLDVHGCMEEYIQAKTNILAHQSPFSFAVLNADNQLTADMQKIVRGKTYFFSRRQAVQSGAYLDGEGYLCFIDNGHMQRLFHKDEIKLSGVHNIENYLAAICAAHKLVSFENMKKVAAQFGGVEHRNELVCIKNGVTWYNDSIATSPTRVNAGLDAQKQKIILIAGGYDKKIPFEPLAPKICQKVKTLILMGATAEKIENIVRNCPDYNAQQLPIFTVSGMEEAVHKAADIAQEGDIVSLSPACASFDMYKNFELRGNHYKQLVQEL